MVHYVINFAFILSSTATVLFSDPKDRIVEHFTVLLMRDALKRTAAVVEHGGRCYSRPTFLTGENLWNVFL